MALRLPIQLHNTLSGEKEEFVPLVPGKVGMYHCGPTVYSYPHVGNLRAYVFADTIRRLFEYSDFKVAQVINITDVGHLSSDADTGRDKMEEGARREGKTAAEIADFYTKSFMADLKALNSNIKGTKFPKATGHIAEQIELIRALEEKGFAYKTSDGMYFDTAKFKDYGKLGNIHLAGQLEGARVEINSEKRHPTDFALWKFSQPHEKRQQEWESPWGVGYPGWHIECSAMSMKYLGETFDIHTGGVEHIPTHHNGEIAQSESATGKQYANYWLHADHVLLDGKKMSKSLGNVLTLSALAEKGVAPLAYRYWLLTSHYRSIVNFTLEAVENAQKTFDKLVRLAEKGEDGGTVQGKYMTPFLERISDDFDTPQAIAQLWKLSRDKTVSEKDRKATLLEMDRLLGLNLASGIAKKKSEKKLKLPKKIANLVSERAAARERKDFAESDRLRAELLDLGYKVIDADSGQEVEKA